MSACKASASHLPSSSTLRSCQGFEEEPIDDIIYRIQVYVFPRRIRVREYFNDFDPLKCGRCTRAQFARALKTIGMRLEDDEVQVLTDHFHDNSPRVQKPQDINYYKFCTCIDEVFNTRSLELSPSASVFSPGATLAMSFVPSDLGDEKEDMVLHILHRLAVLCRTRGVVFKSIYRDIDQASVATPANVNSRNGGKVNENQFMRYFPFKKEMTKEEIALLVEKYKTLSGDVAYGQIHRDVSEAMQTEPPPFPKSDLILRPDQAMWTHQKLHVVEKIRSKVAEKRVRLKEQFQDFDALRKGFCTIGQLKTVFTVLNVDKEISKEDFENLLTVANYVRDDGMFCYAEFCHDVDMAFTIPYLEKTPLTSVAMPDASTTAPARRSRQSLTPATSMKVQELEDKIRTRVTMRRMLIKPAFQDMDRTVTGKVTKNQFARVMQILGFELDETAIALLANSYCDRGNHRDFNYVDFCKSIDPKDDDIEIAMQQLNGAYQDFVPAKYFHPVSGKVIPLDRSSMAF